MCGLVASTSQDDKKSSMNGKLVIVERTLVLHFIEVAGIKRDRFPITRRHDPIGDGALRSEDEGNKEVLVQPVYSPVQNYSQPRVTRTPKGDARF